MMSANITGVRQSPALYLSDDSGANHRCTCGTGSGSTTGTNQNNPLSNNNQVILSVLMLAISLLQQLQQLQQNRQNGSTVETATNNTSSNQQNTATNSGIDPAFANNIAIVAGTDWSIPDFWGDYNPFASDSDSSDSSFDFSFW